MNVNKALSVFIMDEVLPLEKDSFSRAVLGGIATASGLEIFKFKGLDSFNVNQNPEQLHEVIKGALLPSPQLLSLLPTSLTMAPLRSTLCSRCHA